MQSDTCSREKLLLRNSSKILAGVRQDDLGPFGKTRATLRQKSSRPPPSLCTKDALDISKAMMSARHCLVEVTLPSTLFVIYLTHLSSPSELEKFQQTLVPITFAVSMRKGYSCKSFESRFQSETSRMRFPVDGVQQTVSSRHSSLTHSALKWEFEVKLNQYCNDMSYSSTRLVPLQVQLVPKLTRQNRKEPKLSTDTVQIPRKVRGPRVYRKQMRWRTLPV